MTLDTMILYSEETLYIDSIYRLIVVSVALDLFCICQRIYN